MAHRSFTDTAGRQWQVWDVLPYSAERREIRSRRDTRSPGEQRSGRERRGAADRRSGAFRFVVFDQRSGDERRRQRDRRVTHDRREIADADRRAGYDRRAARRTRVELPRGFMEGWLCFETGDEKRRLAPIPRDWTGLDDASLIALLATASVVAPRRQPAGQP